MLKIGIALEKLGTKFGSWLQNPIKSDQSKISLIELGSSDFRKSIIVLFIILHVLIYMYRILPNKRTVRFRNILLKLDKFRKFSECLDKVI